MFRFPYAGRFARVVLGLALCLALVGKAHAAFARLRLYEEEGFKGAATEYIGPATVIGSRFHEAGSARVLSGRWLLCDAASLYGNCVWLSRDTQSLKAIGFEGPVASLSSEVVPLLRRNWGERRPPPRTSITFFSEREYQGDWIAIPGTIAELSTLENYAEPRSVVVQQGIWRLCTQPHFKGRCLIMTGSSWDLANIFSTQIMSVERIR